MQVSKDDMIEYLLLSNDHDILAQMMVDMFGGDVAAWACEMVAFGYYHGAEDARKAIREALGLPEPVE